MAVTVTVTSRFQADPGEQTAKGGLAAKRLEGEPCLEKHGVAVLVGDTVFEQRQRPFEIADAHLDLGRFEGGDVRTLSHPIELVLDRLDAVPFAPASVDVAERAEQARSKRRARTQFQSV